MMRAAPQPKIPSTTMTQARARSCSAQHILRFLFNLLYNYNYNLIIYPYHNDARSPSAQISRCHDDPGTRAQLLAPTFHTPKCARFTHPNLFPHP